MNEERRYPRSSNIDLLAYNPETLALIVRFRGGSSYVYLGVPPEAWAQLKDTTEGIGAKVTQLIVKRARQEAYPYSDDKPYVYRRLGVEVGT